MPRRLKLLSCLVLVSSSACGDDPAGLPDAPPAGPGPADDIGFAAREPLTAGSWLLANDWASEPNVAFVIPIADLGAPRRELFAVNRVWSLGSTADGSRIWFSAFDDQQEAHFGVTFGDSIQNSFEVDTASQTVRAIAPGGWANVNDECHAPSRDGGSLYVCRRYDFEPGGVFSGWRIGRFTLADGAFEFLRPDTGAGPFELGPQELPDARVLFELRERPPATGSSLHARDLTTGTEQLILTGASRAAIAPDGHHVLFRDTSSRTYKVHDLDQPTAMAVEVSPTLDPGDAAWSPDGATIIYTVFDPALSCDHVERVTFDGAVWSAPLRVRDCTATGEFITTISWITVGT